MDKMKRVARGLDRFFHVLQIALVVAAVAALVGLLLIGAYFLFDLAPEMIGTGYEFLELGFLELELAPGYAPSSDAILLIEAVELVMAVAAALLGRSGVVSVRRLLAPMKEGLPFHGAAASSLKRLALLYLILGVVLNLSEGLNILLTNRIYGLHELLAGEKILRVTVNHELDLSCLVISAVLLLLSYVFRYGQELQQLSDETL